MNVENYPKYQKDILTETIELPSPAEIRKLERRCEQEHDDAIWSVVFAPIRALEGLLDYPGQANQKIAGTI